MKTRRISLVTIALSAGVLAGLLPAVLPAQAQEAKSPYPSAAPLDQYLMADHDAEVALARTAAPKSVSDDAEVLVLGRDGYTTAVKGGNGFVCLVERAFAASTDFTEFWNPKNRSPICLNAAAARTHLPFVQMKAKLVFAGKSKAEIAQAVTSALANKELPTPEPGAMCYMMSKQQYLNDGARNWHPHLMWFVPGDAGKSWGAAADSPVMAANDPEEGMTIMMVWVDHWSDGTPGPQAAH
ncbi:MAG TPA: hypothetical protein VG267_05470 [Terracidiphilus sp.]|jgi:hypothetical protein|nr:hypothetical protein [Terracidiphilus sp.]